MKDPNSPIQSDDEAKHLTDQMTYQFLSKLCHELKTPLFPLIALTDLMISHPETLDNREQMSTHMTVMQKAGITLLSIIDDVHLLSKIGSGRYIPRLGVFDANNILISQNPDNISRWVLAKSVPTDGIICDKEAIETLLTCFNSLYEAYNLNRVEPMTISSSGDHLLFTLTLPELSETELEKLTPPFIRPPWGIHDDAQVQSLKFDICVILTQALGGKARFELGDKCSLFIATLPFARPNLTLNSPQSDKKYALVSANIRALYAALLRCRSRGLDVSAVSPASTNRIAAAQKQNLTEVLFDVELPDSNLTGREVKLEQLPDALF